MRTTKDTSRLQTLPCNACVAAIGSSFANRGAQREFAAVSSGDDVSNVSTSAFPRGVLGRNTVSGRFSSQV